MQADEHHRYLWLIQLGARLYIDEKGLDRLRLFSRTLTNLDAASVVEELQYAAAMEMTRCTREQASFEQDAFDAPSIAEEKSNAGNVRFHLASRMTAHAYS